MAHASSRADASLDYNPLTYRDPTGDSAAKNLMTGQYVITHEGGSRLWIDSETLRPLLEQCEASTSRRSGRTHLHLKKSAVEPCKAPTAKTESLPKERS